MKLKNHIILGVVSLLLVSFSSCNFLNVDHYFLDTMNKDSIFANKLNAEGYLFNTATQFPDQGAIWGNSFTPGELASDEMTAIWRTAEFPGISFTVGEINSTKLASFDIWRGMYQIIGRCNYMLANVDNVPDMNIGDKNEYKGYVHFIRGWAYYHLIQNWGPLYIVGDEIYTAEAKPEDFDKSRATYNESVDYICAEFEEAVKFLPLKVTTAEIGRPTKGAAYALIARLRLQQASPTFNGGKNAANRYFEPWVRKSDGKHFVSQERNDTLFALAAFACKRVIDTKLYELNTVLPTQEDKANKTMDSIPSSVKADWPLNFPDGPNGINPYKSYKEMFDGELVMRNITEFIWAEPYSSGVVNYVRHSFPAYLGGWGGMSVPQRVVDEFYMKDGNTIHNASTEYPYDLSASTLNSSNRPVNYWGNIIGGNVYGMYKNREARFYANIGYSRRIWTMFSSLAGKEYVNVPVLYETTQDNGRKSKGNNINPEDYSSTGYVPIKYINYSDALEKGRIEPKPYPIIRLAEIYLGYVEALNELEGKSITITGYDPSTNTEVTETFTRDVTEMQKYFNRIHFRVGLPGLKVIPSKDEMFSLLKKEYQIEFLNENRRYFDTRRWGIYIDDNGLGRSAWRGMNMDSSKPEEYYNGYAGAKQINTQNIRDRQVDAKMLWLPLPHRELLKIPKMEQNYGWDR